MIFAAPTGTLINSFQFLLKYPKIKSKEPSAFCSQPSYTGAMFKPVVGCCANKTAPATPKLAKTRMTVAQRRGRERLIAGLRLPLGAARVCLEFWRTYIVDSRERAVLLPN